MTKYAKVWSDDDDEAGRILTRDQSVIVERARASYVEAETRSAPGSALKADWLDVEPVATRRLAPSALYTLMPEKRLSAYGIRVHRVDTKRWLVGEDDDTLDGERPSAAWLPALEVRLAELRELAREEDVPFSEASAAEAIAFAGDLMATVRPGVFLVGNGNSRFLWTEDDEQIGLQFKDDGTIQYVLFAKRGARLTTHMGDDDAAGVLRQVTAAGVRHLFGSR